MKDQLTRMGDTQTCPSVVLVKDKKILLGFRHYTQDKWQTISVWTCPGGRCDKGECVEEALRREVAEETGITSITILEFLGDISGAKKGDTVPLFLAETNEEPTLMEPEKFSEWRWVSPQEISDNFINPEIKNLIVQKLT